MPFGGRGNLGYHEEYETKRCRTPQCHQLNGHEGEHDGPRVVTVPWPENKRPKHQASDSGSMFNRAQRRAQGRKNFRRLGIVPSKNVYRRGNHV